MQFGQARHFFSFLFTFAPWARPVLSWLVCSTQGLAWLILLLGQFTSVAVNALLWFRGRCIVCAMSAGQLALCSACVLFIVNIYILVPVAVPASHLCKSVEGAGDKRDQGRKDRTGSQAQDEARPLCTHPITITTTTTASAPFLLLLSMATPSGTAIHPPSAAAVQWIAPPAAAQQNSPVSAGLRSVPSLQRWCFRGV